MAPAMLLYLPEIGGNRRLKAFSIYQGKWTEKLQGRKEDFVPQHPLFGAADFLSLLLSGKA